MLPVIRKLELEMDIDGIKHLKVAIGYLNDILDYTYDTKIHNMVISAINNIEASIESLHSK